MAKDSIGREIQVATIQLDMNLPERFDLYCTNESGEKERIVMIHAAIAGSLERLMAVLIEHFAGKFPTWLHQYKLASLPYQINSKTTDRKCKICPQRSWYSCRTCRCKRKPR
ncbi:MAG: aminoacyl--tRNA ligase-related protein [Candidatus Paceibacterota bacterium]